MHVQVTPAMIEAARKLSAAHDDYAECEGEDLLLVNYFGEGVWLVRCNGSVCGSDFTRLMLIDYGTTSQPAKASKPVNPIIVLAGAAASVGLNMLASELLEAGRGHRDVMAIKRSSKRNTGLSRTTMAVITHNRIQQGI